MLWQTYIKILHGSNKAPGSARGIGSRIVEFKSFEISVDIHVSFVCGRQVWVYLLRGRVSISSREFVDCLDEMSIYTLSNDCFHHGKML